MRHSSITTACEGSANGATGDDWGPPSTWMGRFAWVASNYITHQLAIFGPGLVPYLIVAEHPRSGGTWLAHMLAAYLQLPFPKYRRLPTSYEAVIHSHLAYSPRLRRAVFVKRDGRDLVVSSYFKLLKGDVAVSDSRQRNAALLRRYPSLRGATGELEDTRRRLPCYIADWWKRPLGCRFNWEEYTAAWVNHRGNAIVTSYEALNADCRTEVARILESLATSPVDHDRLDEVVHEYSFEAQTGRRSGTEDPKSNKRKGIVGDWRNYFTLEAAREFDRLGGRALMSFGYEKDHAWASACDG